MRRIEKLKKIAKPKLKLGLFLCPLFLAACFLGSAKLSALDEQQMDVKVLEELSPEEEREMIESFLNEGNEFFKVKEYDKANAAYERVFVLDPENIKASGRIDRLKKQMMAEGRSETELVTHVYDAEIEARSHYYWNKSQNLVREKKWGEARFTLEKILLLDPMNKEAEKLYKEVKAKTVSGDK